MKRSQVQVVCTPYTAIVEEYAVFLKVHQLLAQALPFGNAIVESRLSSAHPSTKDVKGAPRRPSPATHSAHQHSIENEEGSLDASTRLTALALPASLLRTWLWHTEAAADGSDADVDPDACEVATRLQSSGEARLSVQPALEYASLTYGPVHAISWAQWEEIMALYKAEEPRQKWYAESGAAAAGKLPARRTLPCILVQVVLLWFHEGRMYRLTPAELMNVVPQARAALTAWSPPPPHAAPAGPSMLPYSTSLFTCYVPLEYPPGTLWPQRIPLPMAEPLLTRQELIELVRATANIRRHHPLRVAYRVWPQATLPTVAAPTAAAPGSGGRAGIFSAATQVVVAAPTTRAPPLRALESDAAMAGLIRAVLAYGCASVQVVAVRSSRAQAVSTTCRQPEAAGSFEPREPQRPYDGEHKMRKAEGRRTVVASDDARGSVERSVTQQNGAYVAVSPLIERENEEAGDEDSEAAIPTVHQGGASDELVCSTPAEAWGTAAQGEKTSGRSCLGSGGGVALSLCPYSHQWHTRGRPPRIDDSDCKAPVQDTPEVLLPDAAPPSRLEESMNSIISISEAALRVAHRRRLSDADEFGETWRTARRCGENVSGEAAGCSADSQQQQLRRVNSDVPRNTFVDIAREEELKAPVRKESSVQYLDKLMTEGLWHGRQAPHAPPVRAPASTTLKLSAYPGDVPAETANEAVADSPPVAASSLCAKLSLFGSPAQPQRAVTSSCGCPATPDPATTVFVRYEVDPTVVCVSGPVLQAVLQHLQDVIFQRCCAHLCQDLDAPRPRFHAAQHYHRASSTPPKAATNSIDSSSVAATSCNGASTGVGYGNGDRNIGDSGLPTATTSAASAATLAAPCSEYILPLYQYTFTRLEEDTLERCIAEIMAVYQGLEQLPAKEAENWMRTAPSLASLTY
ncbi:hypothetical protein JIQ42_05260 [Leishmania sp. Namibia]|uniref:hypothetical protein n=1 Tax=Leishmania sp. Namibia TaxID=2802991 RepID=UPI001B59904A|nr:hypothetical protein JIQ42_05260 [Leishmania sp. Namibia]